MKEQKKNIGKLIVHEVTKTFLMTLLFASMALFSLFPSVLEAYNDIVRIDVYPIMIVWAVINTTLVSYGVILAVKGITEKTK